MSEYQEKSTVVSSERLADDIFRLTLHAPLIAANAHPGQFIMVRTGNSLDPLLRRPFSIHQVSAGDTIQLLYKVVGKGTKLLSELRFEDSLDLIGPLGRGFSLPTEQRVCLIGGGMGIAPLSFLGKKIIQLSRPVDADMVLLGAKNQHELNPLVEDFFDLGYTVKAATDDGSLGHHGVVSDLLDPVLPLVDQVYVCGPFPMMAAVALKCLAASIPCQASLETHMACGLGACLGCTINGANGDYKHVCKHGPVVNAEEVSWTL